MVQDRASAAKGSSTPASARVTSCPSADAVASAVFGIGIGFEALSALVREYDVDGAALASIPEVDDDEDALKRFGPLLTELGARNIHHRRKLTRLFAAIARAHVEGHDDLTWPPRVDDAPPVPAESRGGSDQLRVNGRQLPVPKIGVGGRGNETREGREAP